MNLKRFEWGCVLVVLVGLAFRLAAAIEPIVTWDGAWALVLARSLLDEGRLVVPWTGEPAGYWPPLFPAFLAPFVALLGPSFRTLLVATTAAWAILVAATFLATRDLYGRPRAFAAAALVAASPGFYLADIRGMSESLLGACIVLALWGFVRGAKDARFLAFAALGGTLAYLAKASVGIAFAALAVAAFIAWRAWSLGLRSFLARRAEVALYAAGLLALAALLLVKGWGGVGLALAHPVREAVLRPTFLPILAFKLGFAALFLLGVTLPFSLKAREAWRARRDPAQGALWVAVLAPLVVGAVFTTSFYFTERRILVDFDNARYLTPAIVPFLWIVLPRWDLDPAPITAPVEHGSQRRRTHWTWYALAVALMVLVLLLNPAAAIERPGRLAALLALGAIPVALALVARGSAYAPQVRRTPKGESVRLVPARVGDGRQAIVGLTLSLAVAAFFSSFFVAIGLALVVALSTRSTRARAVAMALMLAVVAVPRVTSYFPSDAIGDGLAEHVPPGAVVAAHEPVYVSATAPEGIRIVATSDAGPGTEWVIAPDAGRATSPNVTRVASWDYGFAYSAPLRASLTLERALLGEAATNETVPAATLYRVEPRDTLK